MLTRFTSSPVAGSLLAAIALAFLSLLASGADGRVRLEASVLDQSRGRDINLTSVEKSCDTLNNAQLCNTGDAGKSCTYCTQKSYLALTGGPPGGATVSATPTHCGKMQEGTCNWLLECANTFPLPGDCQAPDLVISQTDTGVGASD